MAEIIFINSQSQHNKFWSYSIENNDVHIKWGRIGGSSDEQIKHFDSSYELQKFVDKKIREKEKKGYKKETKEKLKKETKTAQALGHQNKIQRMWWVSRDENKLTRIDAYDPGQYVYVEILNSWTKEMTRLLLSKEETWMIRNGISESGSNLFCNSMSKLGYSSFASAVRSVLKELSEVVAAALKTIKFGAIGARSLFDEDEAPQPEISEALAGIDTSSFDSSIINTFAAMGSRSLEL